MSHLWRLVMVFLLTFLSVIGLWAALFPASVARAATIAPRVSASPLQPLSSKPPRRGVHAPISPADVAACNFFVTTPQITGTVDGLGTLGFYTLIPQTVE